MSDFLVSRVREWPMGFKIDNHIGRSQILIAVLAYRPHSDPPQKFQSVPARQMYTMAGRAYRPLGVPFRTVTCLHMF